MLSRPVFRYPTPIEKSDYIDGAIFVFVEGTDPEVLLLVESVSSTNGQMWQFGISRMNRDAIQVTLHGKPVWSAPYIEEVLDRARDPYAVFSLKIPLKDVAENVNLSNLKVQP